MNETTTACVRGCSMYSNHLAECEGDCRGCLPRRATHGNLCDTCHRRLELMIHDAPTVIRWLTGNMTPTASGGAKQDHERIKGDAEEMPAAIKVDLLDLRDLLRDRLTLWVDDWCDHKGLTGPERHTPEVDSAYLLTWLPGICKLDWIGDWWTEMAETMSEAHALAPWRPMMRRLPRVPCPGCEECNLGIYGGESDVTCLSCGIMMAEDQFALWERVLKMDEVEAS